MTCGRLADIIEVLLFERRQPGFTLFSFFLQMLLEPSAVELIHWCDAPSVITKFLAGVFGQREGVLLALLLGSIGKKMVFI